MSAVMSKRCDRCKLVDVTDFSKCKGCGAKYEAKTVKPAGSGIEMGIWPVVGVLLIALWFSQGAIVSAIQKISGPQLTAPPL